MVDGVEICDGTHLYVLFQLSYSVDAPESSVYKLALVVVFRRLEWPGSTRGEKIRKFIVSENETHYYCAE